MSDTLFERVADLAKLKQGFETKNFILCKDIIEHPEEIAIKRPENIVKEYKLDTFIDTELFCSYVADSYMKGNTVLEPLIYELLVKFPEHIETFLPILTINLDYNELQRKIVEVNQLDNINKFFDIMQVNNSRTIPQNIINSIGTELLLDQIYNEHTKEYNNIVVNRLKRDHGLSYQDDEFFLPDDVTDHYRILKLITDFSSIDYIKELSPTFEVLSFDEFITEPKITNLLCNPNLPDELRQELHQKDFNLLKMQTDDKFIVDISYESFSGIMFDEIINNDVSKADIGKIYAHWIRTHALSLAQELDTANKVFYHKEILGKTDMHCLEIGRVLAIKTQHSEVLNILNKCNYLRSEILQNKNFSLEDYNKTLDALVSQVEDYTKIIREGRTPAINSTIEYHSNYRQISFAIQRQSSDKEKGVKPPYKIPADILKRIKNLQDNDLNIVLLKNKLLTEKEGRKVLDKLHKSEIPVSLQDIREAIIAFAGTKVGLSVSEIEICTENFNFTKSKHPSTSLKFKLLTDDGDKKTDKFNDFVKEAIQEFRNYGKNDEDCEISIDYCNQMLGLYNNLVKCRNEEAEIDEKWDISKNIDLSIFPSYALIYKKLEIENKCTNILKENLPKSQRFAEVQSFAINNQQIYGKIIQELKTRNQERGQNLHDR